MPRSFTYCFNRRGAEELAGLEGKPLSSIWGSRFGQVSTGDKVYAVTVRSGRLGLLCRLLVERVDRERGRIVAREGAAAPFDRTVSPELTEELVFLSRGVATPLRFEAPGVLDRQTLRGVRELSAESAALLDRFLDQAFDLPNSQRSPVRSGMRALSVRQPWAELILRGVKTVEVRSRPTKVRERILIYASPIRIDAEQEASVAGRHALDVEALPRSVLLGTVEVVGCDPLRESDGVAAGFEIRDATGCFAWRLARPERAHELLKPRRRPQPVWFYPY